MLESLERLGKSENTKNNNNIKSLVQLNTNYFIDNKFIVIY